MLLDLPLSARIVVDQVYDQMLARLRYREEPWSPVKDVEDFFGKAYYDAVIMRLYEENGEVFEERVPEKIMRWGAPNLNIKKRIPRSRTHVAPSWTNSTTTGNLSYSTSDLFYQKDDFALQDSVATLVLDTDPDVLEALRCPTDHPKIGVLCLVYAPVRERVSQNHMIQQENMFNKRIADIYTHVNPSFTSFNTSS